MDIQFPEVDAKYIKSKLDAGDYPSANDLIKDAVRQMWELDEKAQHFYDAVRIGDEQIARGETLDFSEAGMKAIEKRAIEKAENGEPIENSDVLPE